MTNKFSFRNIAPVALGLAGIVSVFLAATNIFNSKKDDKLTSATVMVKSLSGGGGTGVIISHSPSQSTVLTNNHVCEVVKFGGTVQLSNGDNYLISQYSPSKLHDLCLLYVQQDLKAKSEVAKDSPELYTKAVVSGHPNLLPTVITRGHFSKSEIIQVFMGIRACSRAEMLDEELNMICGFFGGMPILKSFNAVLVTALIMPGSSGSAVYNSDNEIAGLVFAGSGNLSYAYTVPYSYVSNFLYNEPHTPVTINYELDIKRELQRQESHTSYFKYIIKKCSDADTNVDSVIKQYCEVLVKDMRFRGNLWK